MKRRSPEAWLLVLCCTIWVVSCAPEHAYTYCIPEQTDDGWETASLDHVGMNEDVLGDETADLPETHGDRYGYLWWLKTYHADAQSVDAYFASGWGGQRIYLFPSLDMVVVLTGGNYGAKQQEPVDELITRYVLPAVQ